MRRVCSECKAINRIPVRHLADKGKCGKCQTTLPPHAMPIEVTSEAQFDEIVAAARVPILVDFWAAWCGPCRTVAPEVEALADKYGATIKVVKVDVDANQAIAGRYGIRGIPTIGLFEDGKLTKQAVGARPRHAIESELGLTRFVSPTKK